jgi:hypothetical protein
MKRSIVMVSSIVFVVALLGGAAFVGARMLGDQAPPAAEATGPQVIRSGPHGTESLAIVRADELPPEAADVRGIVVEHQDNTLVIGTGKFTLNIQDDKVITDYDGPEVEVVVTHDTVVYRDRTDYLKDKGQDGEIQQVVKPGTLEEIGPDSVVSAWGQERGSRLFADVVVYNIPLD